MENLTHAMGELTIAENADVSRSTFFSHFDSVDSLLSEIAAEEINDIFEAVENDEAGLTVAALFHNILIRAEGVVGACPGVLVVPLLLAALLFLFVECLPVHVLKLQPAACAVICHGVCQGVVTNI